MIRNSQVQKQDPKKLGDFQQQPRNPNQKELKKSTRAKLALLGSISDVSQDFYYKGASATVPSMYLKFQNPTQPVEEEFKAELKQDQDKKSEEGEDEHECPTFQYGK